MQANGKIRQRFSIRKSHLGPSGVLLGVSIVLLSGGITVQAEQIDANLDTDIVLSQPQLSANEDETAETSVEEDSVTPSLDTQAQTLASSDDVN